MPEQQKREQVTDREIFSGIKAVVYWLCCLSGTIVSQYPFTAGRMEMAQCLFFSVAGIMLYQYYVDITMYHMVDFLLLLCSSLLVGVCGWLPVSLMWLLFAAVCAARYGTESGMAGFLLFFYQFLVCAGANVERHTLIAVFLMGLFLVCLLSAGQDRMAIPFLFAVLFCVSACLTVVSVSFSFTRWRENLAGNIWWICSSILLLLVGIFARLKPFTDGLGNQEAGEEMLGEEAVEEVVQEERGQAPEAVAASEEMAASEEVERQREPKKQSLWAEDNEEDTVQFEPQSFDGSAGEWETQRLPQGITGRQFIDGILKKQRKKGGLDTAGLTENQIAALKMFLIDQDKGE